jgi:hypothetical protein
MYRFCKLFGATPAEYDARPYDEVTLLLKIHGVYNEVAAELAADNKTLLI